MFDLLLFFPTELPRLCTTLPENGISSSHPIRMGKSFHVYYYGELIALMRRDVRLADFTTEPQTCEF